MELRITIINELRKCTGIGFNLAVKCLTMADYDMDLAIKIAEYYTLVVHKNYPVGKVIREYWESKARE